MLKFHALVVAALFTTYPALLACSNPLSHMSDQPEQVPDMPKMAAFDEGKVKALLAGVRGGDRMRNLLRARHHAAVTELEARFKDFLAGLGTLDILLKASERVLKVELEMSTTKADLIAARESHLGVVKTIHEVNRGRFNAGRIAIQDVVQAEYFRLDAEIDLERAKGRPTIYVGD
jgi:hypothetical protein